MPQDPHTAGEVTAEELAQRAFDLDLLSEQQLRDVWAELGRRDVPVDEMRQLLMRRELLTGLQIKRLLRGERSGYFYGDYKVAYVIGSGTFARVYRGVHRQTGQIVGVKVLRRRFSEDEHQRVQFLREGEVGRTLRHPNIVPIYEVCSQKDSHFLILEFVEGRTLREFLYIRKKFDPAEATKLLTGVAAGLDYAFNRGITHRDLKTSNILVSSQRQPKLVDFGLAAADPALNDELLTKIVNPRTIDYAGLERATGVRKDDTRSDIYFLGCIYYHMLAGVPPMTETRDRLLRLSRSRFTDVKPIREVAPWVPQFVANVVNKAMELNPKLRYQSPGEMLADLRTIARYLEDGRVDEIEDEIRPLLIGDRPATVMLVESDTKRQDLLREALRKTGYRVLVTDDPARVVTWFEEQPDVADSVIFSAAELGDAALTSFRRFSSAAATRQVPVLLLLGPQHKKWQAEHQLAGHHVPLFVSATTTPLLAALKRLMPTTHA
jgi:eukaryotic-like serine/threonine-protein kinase